MRKNFRGFVAVVGETLKESALDHKSRMRQGDAQDYGILMGYAFALDTMYDYLEMFGLTLADLNWAGFSPERELLGVQEPPE